MKFKLMSILAVSLVCLLAASCGDDSGDDGLKLFEQCLVDEDCNEGLICAYAIMHPSIDYHYCTRECSLLRDDAIEGQQWQTVDNCGEGYCWITGVSSGADGIWIASGLCVATGE